MPINFLHKIFTAIPPSYDVINHLITFCMDIRWRKKAAKECAASKPGSVLDICCGTGDLALSVAGLAGDQAIIYGLDFSMPMLEAAKNKASVKYRDIKFVAGDAAALPFGKESLDCICIGFGFRNLTYKNTNSEKHLSEIQRALKKGGRLVIVESSQPVNGFIRFIFKLYVRYYVFAVGYFISRNRQAYKYFSASVENFYSAEEVKDLLVKSGFSGVSFEHLFFGAVAVHIAVKRGK